MSQLRAGRTATFHIRKLGVGGVNLIHRREALFLAPVVSKGSYARSNWAVGSAEGLAEQIIEPVGKGMDQT